MGINIKITAKCCALKRLRFEGTKRIMSAEMRPKNFGTFKKRAPVQDVPSKFREPNETCKMSVTAMILESTLRVLINSI